MIQVHGKTHAEVDDVGVAVLSIRETVLQGHVDVGDAPAVHVLGDDQPADKMRGVSDSQAVIRTGRYMGTRYWNILSSRAQLLM